MIELSIKDRIATITFSRPEAMNALNSDELNSLETKVDEAIREDVRAIIFTGAGKAFIAGADIKEMENLRGMDSRIFSERGQRLFRKIETLPIVTIAAVNGYTFGGGVEFALACDLRIASEKAKFGLPESGLGIAPGFSGTQRLPRAVGRMQAIYMMTTGETLDAARAKEIGLVLEVIEPESLLPRAQEIAQTIASNSKTAISVILDLVDRGLDSALDVGIGLEGASVANLFGTDDQVEGMVAFAEKRKPKFI